ncbi:S41 family peptidase [Candidatus Gracilibacteria bacterium]|nr:S41 family peptidase [Candidatus Gracilibacteria bacterium]
MMRKTTTLFLTSILFLLSVFLFVQNSDKNTTQSLLSKENLTTLSEVKSYLDNNLPTPSEKKISDSVIHSFVEAYGDQFSEYFSPEELVSFQTMIDGDFEGIGAYVEDSPSGVYISGVLPDSPAQKAGLLPGDIIQTVDNQSMYDKTANEAVQKIRGPAGTPVVLGIFSSILSTKKQVTLLRQKLEIPIVTDELIGNTLFIELFSFNDYSGRDIAEILQKYSGKYTSILLDLRNNGGGTLQSAVDVGSLFLDKDSLIASVEGKETAVHTSQGRENLKTPLYILVNGQTASAAEILASALHTHLGAPIFGSQTYGKGSVQQLFPLSNGGQIKITIAHWKTAAGDLLDKIGIKPDTIILPSPRDITEGRDIQKEKALEIISTK